MTPGAAQCAMGYVLPPLRRHGAPYNEGKRMKNRIWMAAVVAGALGVAACAAMGQAPKATKAPTKAPAPKEAAKSVELKTQMDKVSYGIGYSVARNLKSQKIAVNVEALVRGLRDTLSGAKPLLTSAQIDAVMMAWQSEMQGKQMKEMAAVGAKNKAAGDAYLAKNKTAEGVVTLPSGLQYKILKAGDGKKPLATDTVECNYRGTLIDGTEFDSSYKRGTPASFQVTGVIPGWTEALQLMPVGSKWQLAIPGNLAYGPSGAGRQIGPDTTLIFEVELLAIK
jgi:FKBP-type peptidyl-prolyl cis-trans isomerase FklB